MNKYVISFIGDLGNSSTEFMTKMHANTEEEAVSDFKDMMIKLEMDFIIKNISVEVGG